MPVGTGPVDPRPFATMADRRAAQPAVDPEARMRLVVDHEPTPEPIGAPVPGAMAVLALTALLVSASLGIARAMGVDMPWWAVFAPMWGSALAVTLAALALAIPAAIGDARAWVRRRGQ